MQPAAARRSVESELVAAGRGGARTRLHDRRRRQRELLVPAAGRRVSGRAGNPGPVRQEGHGQAAAPGAGPGRQDSWPSRSRNSSPPRPGPSNPAQPFTAVWGSGYDQARAFVEIEHRNKIVQSFWTEAGRTQVPIQQAVTEAMRGGFTLRVTMVRENRAYLESRRVDVPWSNKNLTVKWEHFVSKLAPASRRRGRRSSPGPTPRRPWPRWWPTLYDASLDAYLPHNWPAGFGVFRQDHSRLQSQFENQVQHLQHLRGQWRVDQKDASFTLPRRSPPTSS